MNTGSITSLFRGMITTTAILLTLGCQIGLADDSESNESRHASELSIIKVEWDSDDGMLDVKGKGHAGKTVSIYDSSRDNLLGKTKVKKNGKWTFSLAQTSDVPCRVEVRSGDDEKKRKVKNAPENCGRGNGSDDSDYSAGNDRDKDEDKENEHDKDDDDSTDNGGNDGPGGVISGDYQIFAVNDLGMHCMDEDYSVFSVLPPFNTLQAQVVRKGREPVLMSPASIEVRYNAIADASGSINSTSIGKTNFWDHSGALFGATPEPDVGLTGNKMPSQANGAQLFAAYEQHHQRHVASGIPITPWDDFGQHNSYPMFRVEAIDKASGQVLTSIDTVVPVSEEMACADCHHNDGVAADATTAARYGNVEWSIAVAAAVQYKENILLLHDAKHNTQLINNQPVLCAQCHYSPALDLAGSGPQGAQNSLPFLSYAIHKRHGETVDGNLPIGNIDAIIRESGKTTCYNCHPGEQTQCFRGAMANAGLICQDCHGGMLAVGGQYPLADGRTRVPWQDLPKCQSCHTGDALNHQGSSMVRYVAYDPGDKAATPLLADNKRFSESDTALYRNSAGHGEMACTACHGSPHAIWPNEDPDANDNVAAKQIQGYVGTITECSSCHTPGSLPLTLAGPHGMHNVNDARWNEDHEDYFERDPASCQSCHGVNLEGTRLSRTAVDRTFQTDDDGSIYLAKGTEVSCTLCHERP